MFKLTIKNDNLHETSEKNALVCMSKRLFFRETHTKHKWIKGLTEQRDNHH